MQGLMECAACGACAACPFVPREFLESSLPWYCASTSQQPGGEPAVQVDHFDTTLQQGRHLIAPTGENG